MTEEQMQRMNEEREARDQKRAEEDGLEPAGDPIIKLKVECRCKE